MTMATEAPTIDGKTRSELTAAFSEYLSGHLYVCGRHESAWSHGTMGLDDFSPAEDNEEVLDSLVQIALEKLGFSTEEV